MSVRFKFPFIFMNGIKNYFMFSDHFIFDNYLFMFFAHLSYFSHTHTYLFLGEVIAS